MRNIGTYIDQYESSRIEEGEAYAITRYWPEVGELYLSQIRVPESQRRQGIGSRLLEGVMEVAAEKQAKTITAQIVSHEFLGLARKFFGEEAVWVQYDGTSSYDARPVAKLDYKLPD
jgi:GNAT superfamily N-acetyltransferase